MKQHTNFTLDPLTYALNLVGEEGSEIAKQVSKILRFGMLDTPPHQTANNLELLQGEITDLIAVVKILNFELVKRGHPPIDLNDRAAIDRKFDKVGHFAMQSIEMETLSEPLTIMT